MEEPKLPVEQKATDGNVQPDETNNNQSVDDTTQKTNEAGEEQVNISAKELKTLQNKARDFDGLVAKKDKQKFQEAVTGETPKIDEDSILEKATNKALEIMRQEQVAINSATFKENLPTALDKIQAKYKFLTGEKLAAVSQSFDQGDALSVEQIAAKLESTVKQVLPTEYEENLRTKITEDIMSGNAKLNIGGIGEGNSVNTEPKALTEEEKTSAKYNKNYPPGFSA